MKCFPQIVGGEWLEPTRGLPGGGSILSSSLLAFGSESSFQLPGDVGQPSPGPAVRSLGCWRPQAEFGWDLGGAGVWMWVESLHFSLSRGQRRTPVLIRLNEAVPVKCLPSPGHGPGCKAPAPPPSSSPRQGGCGSASGPLQDFASAIGALAGGGLSAPGVRPQPRGAGTGAPGEDLVSSAPLQASLRCWWPGWAGGDLHQGLASWVTAVQ